MNKISLIGAGNIGGTLAHLSLIKNLGDITLIDVVEGMPQGKALDLSQSSAVERFSGKIEGTNDFESEIAKVFDIKNSEKRKNNLQRLINKDLKFISRSRKDVKKVIVSSSSDIANRIIPAFKYNLLFDLEIYNLPNHYDCLLYTSPSPRDS